MKKKYRWAAVAAIFLSAACAKEELPDVAVDAVPLEYIEVGIDSQQTKVAFSDVNAGKLFWTKGDQIAVFSDEKNFSQYTLSGEGGTAEGRFTWTSGTKVSKVFKVVYPYSSVTLDGNFSIPRKQSYTEGSFDPNALVLVSEGIDEKSVILMKHVAAVFEVSVSGNASDQLSNLTFYYNDGTEKKYTLDCGNVQLSETAKPFYIVVDPCISTTNMYVQAVFSNSTFMTKTAQKFPQFLSGELHRLPAFSVGRKSGWTIGGYNSSKARDMKVSYGIPHGPFACLIDGNPRTWCDAENKISVNEPFEIVIKPSENITEFHSLTLFPVLDKVKNPVRPRKISVSFSNKGTVFGESEAQEFVNETAYAQWNVELNPKSARFIKIKILEIDNTNTNNWCNTAVLSEIEIN